MMRGTKPSDPGILRFATFELAPYQRELRRAGVLLKIQEQPFKLLVLLAERSGEILSRDQIRQALWGSDTFVDFERNINFCINQIRATLGDDRQSPRFLETVPRRGYRFIAPVVGSRQPAVSERDPNSVAIVQFTNLTGDSDAAWLGWAIAESVTVDLQKLTWLPVLSSERTLLAISRLGLDKVSEREIPLLKEALPATWVVWGGYQKIGSRIRITAHFSRTATGDLMGSTKVDGMLEHIFQLEDQIVTGLLEALSISLSSAERLKIEKPETASLQAYEYYVRGRQQFNDFGKASLDQAKELFEKAVAIHPHYALANSSLGSAYLFRFIASAEARELDIGIGYLQKAIKEDPELAEAHTWLTYAYMRSRRYDDALGAGKRAVELDPGSYMAFYMLGSVYVCRAALKYKSSLFADAFREFKNSIAVEPNYPWSHMHLGWISMVHGQYPAAERFLEEALAIQDTTSAVRAWPRFYGTRTVLGVLSFRQGHASHAEDLHRRSIAELSECDHVYREIFLAVSYCGLGDVAFRRHLYEEALEEFLKAEDLLISHPRSVGSGHILIQALLRQSQARIALDQTEKARRQLERARELLAHKNGFDFAFIWEAWDAQSYYELGTSQALFGKAEHALTYLKKAIACGWRDHQFLNTDVRLNTLRGTAGFRDLGKTVSDYRTDWNGAPSPESAAHLESDITLPGPPRQANILSGEFSTHESE
jgi:DNA-binding winged helix-turn-helix (wHTH) protein/tetratricopeptide (TPR) repeat protein